ncbi:cob(I)yrinic acid a,c-diamide adenosyltransferase [Sphingomonas sp. SUN039]|uniref:cob(I)yrinic acid a,c-diamide adenosyltransferase n=1 Tax=Sphingomonas sp. SUN039 TaxID=2937787 RepID=UPI0021643609|nr:cob(I)yrinic acid a,c-diamide adenosyltransferase [Sphingomonas sp. SUN039]UVO55114.1 cob(I)yrinic acid a,c-diamide adenosyltransferase [Sphingomonas sp. SUN039]
MVKLNKIYTRTGDDGTSGLVDGSRVSKASALMTAIGDVDEANSLIGVAAVLAEGAMCVNLAKIQNDLFDLGADIATPDKPVEWTPLRVVDAQVDRLEAEIDAMNAHIAPLTSFVLPGGSALAAALHVARAAARRAERSAVAANAAEPLNPQALAYLNRLSDWLFVAARAANANGVDDVLWVPGASRA